NIYIIRTLNNIGFRYGLSWHVFTGVLVAGFFALAIGLVASQQWLVHYSSDLFITVLSGIVVCVAYLFFVFFLKLISHEEMGFLKSFLKRTA
ncbi:MAG: hypothetical protein B7Y34_05620, partial [Methylophilales bacterium 16-45-9]